MRLDPPAGGGRAHAQAPAATATTAVTATTTAELDLPDLVKLSLENNRLVKLDVARIEEARALYEYAAAQSYPAIQGNALIGGPTAEARTRVVNDLNTLTPASLEGDFKFGELGITLRFEATGVVPVYTFGKISQAKSAAKQLIEASEERVHITEADVILNVHKAFWAYQLTRSFVRSLREGDEILAKVIRTVEGLIADDSPQVTENDRLRLVHAQAALRVRLHEADSASKVALAALHLLTGTPHGAPLLLVSRELDEVPPPPPPVEALLAEARVQRPELRALLHLIDAAEHYVRFRTRGFFPDFFIGVFISSAWTSNATDQTNPFIYDRFNVNDAGLGIGMRFQLDVFTKLAEVKQAQAQLDVQIASHSAAEEAIELEVRKVHLELVGNLEKLDPAEKAFRASRGWLTAAVLAYDLGVGDASELIDAFLARATSEGDLRKTQFDLLIGAAELERAAGDLLEKSNL